MAGKVFCCEGCRQVYLLLSESGLCVYYSLDENPGIKAKGSFTGERFAYLDDEATVRQLVQYSSSTQTNVTFSLPQMHCSSCIYLLENLHRLDDGIVSSQTNFQRKEIFIRFDPRCTSLRKVVQLLAFTGYEPRISLKDAAAPGRPPVSRSSIYRIGVAGFCFANIMMLSFPEYFSAGHIEQQGLQRTFSWLIFALSLPVLLYSAMAFFIPAWKGLRQRYLNIDAPVALAILVTFARSYYEIITGTGAGYLDSGTGIVFFMLAGRWFQNKTHDSLSFDRDYRSYFPLGVNVVENGKERNIPVTQLHPGSRIIIRSGEMIPADAVLLNGAASIDYSFVSGENTPVQLRRGELLYAGGRQTGGAIELEVRGEVSQSYITRLWNNDVFRTGKNTEKSFVHPWSRYFTLALFTVALGALVYWWAVNPAMILPAVSSVLIVACPCSLLLSATFTYGNMLRIFGRNRLYLKNAAVIESLARTDTVVFDKTGTLTSNETAGVEYTGEPLLQEERAAVQAVVSQSAHPLSHAISTWLQAGNNSRLQVLHFAEYPGRGVAARCGVYDIQLGSAAFVQHSAGISTAGGGPAKGAAVHLLINGQYRGCFTVGSRLRYGVEAMVDALKKKQISSSLLSGDNDAERSALQRLFGSGTVLRFGQSPQQKLDCIRAMQQTGSHVLMLGDGLNDAGALMQSNTGVAVTDNTAGFSPACDAILHGSKVHLLDRFIAYAKAGKKIVAAGFALSVLYNIAGLSFAVRGLLSPMVAAILMPASSISIILLAAVLSSAAARALELNRPADRNHVSF